MYAGSVMVYLGMDRRSNGQVTLLVANHTTKVWSHPDSSDQRILRYTFPKRVPRQSARTLPGQLRPRSAIRRM